MNRTSDSGHYWRTDKDGEKVFGQTDTIRQLFMRNTHSAGTLVQPFREKVAERWQEVKLLAEDVPVPKAS